MVTLKISNLKTIKSEMSEEDKKQLAEFFLLLLDWHTNNLTEQENKIASGVKK